MGHPKITEKTGIGQKQRRNGSTRPRSLKRSPFQPKFSPTEKPKRLRFRSKTSKRGREAGLLPLVIGLIVKQYEFEYGDGYCEGLDPDHILGRNHPGFRLGAMLDPENIQMIPPKLHAMKTDKKGSGEQIDFRTTKIKARMKYLTDTILGMMPEVWNLKDLKTALMKLSQDAE